ncbi:hypothetical protein TNCV_346771 [Trichonephila clavipes]|nr:hypothetical protein TNCV_346771 [Trichonephila clavipes]
MSVECIRNSVRDYDEEESNDEENNNKYDSFTEIDPDLEEGDTLSFLYPAYSVKRLANQRLHLGRNEVSDWLDARHSTFVRLGVNEPLNVWRLANQILHFARDEVSDWLDA